MIRAALLGIGFVVASGAAPLPGVPVLAAAPVIQRLPTTEATQAAVGDGRFVYAVGNHSIGKYDRASGQRVAVFDGDPALFPHMNSCVTDKAELVCAASNYPDVPMASSVEIFDRTTLRHLRTTALPPLPGSLTSIERHDGSWWATLANYDGRGGAPGRDHRSTLLVRLDDQLRPVASWLFPQTVLDRFSPRSCSGASWGDDGRLYVTGHDRPEMYVLDLPKAGATLRHVATVPLATGGQAIGWDRSRKRVLWSIDRATRAAVASNVPAVQP